MDGRSWRDRQAASMRLQNVAAVRRALLQRVADRLAFARVLQESGPVPLSWCCWMPYVATEPSGRTLRVMYRICDDDCPHWHHERELFLA